MRRARLIGVGLCVLLGGCFRAEVNTNGSAGKGPSEHSDWRTWMDLVAGGVGPLVAAEHGVLFYAYDTLALPGEPVDLVVRLQRGKNLRALRDVTVGFYSGTELLGTARTQEDGLARIAWTPPKAGDYLFTVRPIAMPEDIDGEYRDLMKVTPATLLVAARTKDAELVVIDLDHTLVDDNFERVLTGQAKPMADSAEVAGKIAQRYSIVYLTHRWAVLTCRSKSWLRGHGYPAGPLLVSGLKEALGDSGRFKSARLAEIRKEFPNVRIGIGDLPSDAQAYVDNALTAYLIPSYKPKPKEMRKLAKEIRGLRNPERLQVVASWREVEAGILAGVRYPAEAFARDLEARANQLEADAGAVR